MAAWVVITFAINVAYAFMALDAWRLEHHYERPIYVGQVYFGELKWR